MKVRFKVNQIVMARLPTADLHGTSFELVSVVADLSASALRHQVGTKYMYLGRTRY